jgi:hypothetical protein
MPAPRTGAPQVTVVYLRGGTSRFARCALATPPETPLARRRATRAAELYAVIACLVLLLGVQWILLSIAIEGFLGGPRDLLVPSALVSALCCAVSWRIVCHAR